VQPKVEANKSEELLAKTAPEAFSISTFYSLDNKLIDAYYTKKRHFNSEEKDLLEEEEFLFLACNMEKDLEYLLSLQFVHFWVCIRKVPEIMAFLDGFLQNVRKHNDLYKVQFFEGSADAERKDLDYEVKMHMNNILKCVFKIFFRLSNNLEGPEDYFTKDFYQSMIYDNFIFDMAKLLDIAAVFGLSNSDAVSKLIENVFENDKRYI